MGGGLLQLAAYGGEDIYLTGNPQLTFFKSVFKRHTNYAIETIENVYSAVLEYGATIRVNLQRHGDLISSVFLELQTSESLPYNHNLYTIIDWIELQIGGVTIDKQYGDWMFIWSQLNNRIDQFMLIDAMIYSDDTTNAGKRRYYAPLPLWFCKHSGLALPIIALSNHEVKLNIKFKNMPSETTPIFEQLRVLCDYVFLDTDERRRFADNANEYLIEQVQEHPFSVIHTGSNNIELNFKHPVKYLTFYIDLKENEYNRINTYYQSTDGVGNVYNEIFENTTLLVNNQQLFAPRYGPYFRLYQQFKYFQGSTLVNKWVGTLNSIGLERVYTYSFALKASDYAPSGTMNFSRLSDCVLQFNIPDLTSYSETVNQFRCFAVNYNILRIVSGMGGLAYV